ncbi:lipopolysaccharide biosynthesis protein [Riemerella anatipestifer]|uniref:glycosyl transferase family 90 n=1 Tax=Riemerella anatipestifer TaxID=34085 RepID=UPI0030BD814D
MKMIKKNKLLYYLESYARFLRPSLDFDDKITQLVTSLSDTTLEKIRQRVDYYNQLNQPKEITKQLQIKDLKHPKTPKVYYFDTYEYARFFDHHSFFDCIFGDVIHIPDTPSIVKSRPINPNNQNSILLNLDKVRHFVWVKKDIPFSEKKTLLIGRGAVVQNHRIDFYQKYFKHPLCNLGQTNQQGGNPEWIKPKITLKEHLKYKFILSLQGNDVATNLKWIMSSNSIAVMPKPTIESWFMEGTLVGGKHYIEVKPDYSDLEEQLNFYSENTDICLEIIHNAHQYCQQFWNPDIEDLCSLWVLKKYFEYTHNY